MTRYCPRPCGTNNDAVFRYEFTVPGQTIEYTVMWDYNVGLVRMTPFFKCCRYGKVSNQLSHFVETVWR